MVNKIFKPKRILITIPLFHTPKWSCISRLELWGYGGKEWMGVLSGTRKHEENQSMWQPVDLALFIDAIFIKCTKEKNGIFILMKSESRLGIAWVSFQMHITSLETFRHIMTSTVPAPRTPGKQKEEGKMKWTSWWSSSIITFGCPKSRPSPWTYQAFRLLCKVTTCLAHMMSSRIWGLRRSDGGREE